MRTCSVVVLACCIAVVACSRSRQYELRGQVLAIDRSGSKLTIKHEDIRGFMPGMTMAFDVRDPRLLEGREPGELIVATLVVEGSGGYLSSITRTGIAPLAESPPPASVDVLQPGELVPDAEFVDHSGRPRRFSDWRGQAVAVTFVYTRCPIANFCPLMDRNFRDVQKTIVTDASLRGRAHLLSITLDPAYDTPKILSEHAARVGADAAQWTWLTGKPEELDRLASAFGVSIVKSEKPAADIVHNLRTAVVGSDGRIVAVMSGNEWTPSDLVRHLKNGLR